MAPDIQSDVGKKDERTGSSQGDARLKAPLRWRNDEATCPRGVDLLLRAVHCPVPLTPEDRIRLSMRLNAILRQPTGGTVHDGGRPAEQRSGGAPLDRRSCSSTTVPPDLESPSSRRCSRRPSRKAGR
jgi:hypothetical protein